MTSTMVQGLLIPLEDPKMWLVAKGALRAARFQSAAVVIYGMSYERSFGALDGETMQRAFSWRQSSHDGLLLAFAGEGLQHYAQKLCKESFPTMLVARTIGNVPCAVSNNRETLCGAVKALAEKGHRQIAFIAGPSHNFSAQERLIGYRQGLQEAGIEFDPALIIEGDYTEKTAHQNTKEFLSRGKTCSALAASNDLSAFGAMQALREAGISPGADVEVVGFDNIPRANWVKPSLSTFDPLLYQMGYQACEELMKCIRKEPFQETITIPTVFIPRMSTWEIESDKERQTPLIEEWKANRFYYEVQLEGLKSAPNAAVLLEQLKANLDTPESFLQSFRELLEETDQAEASVLCLLPILRELEGFSPTPGSGAHHPMMLHALLDQAHGLLSAAVFDEQKRHTETALRYTASTARLRGLTFSASVEEAVIAALRDTIRELEIPKAGVYLFRDPQKLSESGSSEGEWHWWDDLHDTEASSPLPSHLESFDIALLQVRERPAGWLILPLLYGEELFGMVTLDANSEFLMHYPDLVRIFAVSLRACRMREALAKANAELVETSRLAGLAEMATGVLHNIGNALNSVNTSCSMTTELVRKSRITSIARLAQLLEEHSADLGAFLSTDPKGQQIPTFLSQLSGHLQLEQENILRELAELREKVDHINQIVAAQQSHAHVSGIVESIAPVELLEFALKLSEASLSRHQITVQQDFSPAPEVKVQRQKAVQILVNIIRNAKESMGAAKPQEKILTLTIAPGGNGRVSIGIGDNGLGIPQENLARIFAFGFSTKPGGHGFGLHNSALAAKEMGGSLSARSDGPGKGATFLLELPTS